MGDWDASRMENTAIGYRGGRQRRGRGVDRWHCAALCGMRTGKEGESSTLYVAVIFYGLSRITLEREPALPTV